MTASKPADDLVDPRARAACKVGKRSPISPAAGLALELHPLHSRVVQTVVSHTVCSREDTSARAMAFQGFQLLDQAEEDALHYTRLLTVEERPFQRVSKKLVSRDAMINHFPHQLPTPPPDADNDEADGVGGDQADTQDDVDRERLHWRQELLLDFEALESTLNRIQLLKDSNARELARYASEKAKILETAQAVRDNTTHLRRQLEEAQKTLALRKQYDGLTEKILSNRMLKPREEQTAQLDKLANEIADLDAEGKDYEGLWRDRREQFHRMTEEGKQMLRLIKGVKEDETTEEMEDSQEREDGEASTTKGESSAVGTPGPETGNATPMRAAYEGDEPSNKLLQKAMGVGVSTPGRGTSRAVSPSLGDLGSSTPAGAQDTAMGEAEPVRPQPDDADELEEGETADDPVDEIEQMDVS